MAPALLASGPGASARTPVENRERELAAAELGVENLGRVVGRGVVDDDQLEPRHPQALVPQAAEQLRELLRPIPGGDDDADLGSCGCH